MERPVNLERLQRQFWKFISAPEGVEKAIEPLSKEEPDSVPLRNWLKMETEAQAVQRLNIYANAYFYRIHDVIKSNYEHLAKSMGDTQFHNLITSFLFENPSTVHDVGKVGYTIPEYLDTHPEYNKPVWLSDLARMERALREIFKMANHGSLSLEELQAIPPEQWGELRFEVIPSYIELELSYDVQKAYLASEQDQPLPEIEEKQHTLLVWREGFNRRHGVLEGLEKQAFRCLQQQQTFGEICAVFFGEDEDLTAATQQAFQVLLGWLNDKLLLRTWLDTGEESE